MRSDVLTVALVALSTMACSVASEVRFERPDEPWLEGGDAGVPMASALWLRVYHDGAGACDALRELGARSCERFGACDDLLPDLDRSLEARHAGDPRLSAPIAEVRSADGRLQDLPLTEGGAWELVVRVDGARASGGGPDFDDVLYGCELVRPGRATTVGLWRPWCSRRTCGGHGVVGGSSSEPDVCAPRCVLPESLDVPALRAGPCARVERPWAGPRAEGPGLIACAGPEETADRGACARATLDCATGAYTPGRCPGERELRCRDTADVAIDRNYDASADLDCDGSHPLCAQVCASNPDATLDCVNDFVATGTCQGTSWRQDGNLFGGCLTRDVCGDGVDDDGDGLIDEEGADADYGRRDELGPLGARIDDPSDQAGACNEYYPALRIATVCRRSNQPTSEPARCWCGVRPCADTEFCDLDRSGNPVCVPACGLSAAVSEACAALDCPESTCAVRSADTTTLQCVARDAVCDDDLAECNVGRAADRPRASRVDGDACRCGSGGACGPHQVCCRNSCVNLRDDSPSCMCDLQCPSATPRCDGSRCVE